MTTTTTADNVAIYNYLQWDPDTASGGQPDEAELEALSQQGVDWIINLGLLDTDYALADEVGQVKRLRMQYRHIPVCWESPCYEDFVQFSSIIQVTEGSKRFVHCAANYRASVFVGMYYHLFKQLSYEQVLATVHQIWRPNVIWQQMMETILDNRQHLLETQV